MPPFLFHMEHNKKGILCYTLHSQTLRLTSA